MAAASPERLEAVRRVRRHHARVQRRRTLAAAAAALVAVTIFAVTLTRIRNATDSTEGAVASPVASSSADLGNPPPDRTIARVNSVEINLPIGRASVRETLFRAIDDPAAVAMKPDGSWKHTVATGGEGPNTAGMDIAAPPETIVFSPVDGTITGVRDYVVAGRVAGYQVDISPDAASDVVVRVRHIVEVPVARRADSLCGSAGVERPHVGQVLVAGVTCIGEIRPINDLLPVARPVIAKYVSDGGNHVHVEVLRVGA